jgi:hypothetical protein
MQKRETNFVAIPDFSALAPEPLGESGSTMAKRKKADNGRQSASLQTPRAAFPIGIGSDESNRPVKARRARLTLNACTRCRHKKTKVGHWPYRIQGFFNLMFISVMANVPYVGDAKSMAPNVHTRSRKEALQGCKTSNSSLKPKLKIIVI